MDEPYLCASCGSRAPSGAPDHTCGVCGGPVALDGRYALVAELGAGAMGMTYEAVRWSDGERVAIKELTIARMGRFRDAELFEREARVLAQLDHPGIPRGYDAFVWGVGKHQAFYLVEQLIDGCTLTEWLETHRVGELEVLELIEQMTHILEHLHTRAPPIIHRDIKPDNVMRRPSGELVLIDFGAVRDALATRAGASTTAGTFGYMAPEQLRGDASPASDIWALGVLALVALTRRTPPQMMSRTGQLEWARHLDASGALASLLQGMLAPDPRARIDSARALRARVVRARRALLEPPSPDHSSVALVRSSTEPKPRRPRESLFGIGALMITLPVFSIPCLLASFGPVYTLVILSGVMMAVFLLVPFLPGSPEADVPQIEAEDARRRLP